MDFEQIEDLLPDGAFTIGSGHTCVTAQWLHDFARNIAAAERETCAKIADARAMRCEEKTADADDDDERINLRSLAWQFSVLAAEMRKPSNAKVTGSPALSASPSGLPG